MPVGNQGAIGRPARNANQQSPRQTRFGIRKDPVGDRILPARPKPRSTVAPARGADVVPFPEPEQRKSAP